MDAARVNSYDRSAPRPRIGSRWVWEPELPHAREDITVISVRWNGEEWWVESETCSGIAAWNDLSRFWEAVLPAPATQTAL